jgi:hypothetical protein
MADNGNSGQADTIRVKYGFWIVLAGLAVVLAVFVAAIVKWTTASDVASAVGSVTGVVGTVVGAFFGLQAGAAGKEKAEDQRKEAEDRTLLFAGELPPGAVKRLLAKTR